MNIVRQDSSIKTQEYYVPMGDRKGWEFEYNEISYPREEDKPRGAVKASLTIQESVPNNFPSRNHPGDTSFFTDVIYLGFDGKISRHTDELGYSPAICNFKELDTIVQEEILSNLSPEAKALLGAGISEYKGYKNPECCKATSQKPSTF